METIIKDLLGKENRMEKGKQLFEYGLVEKRILVTGANGQLGSEIRNKQSGLPNCKFFFTDIEELDLSDPVAVINFINHHNIQYVINCAAYTAVDKAEEDQELCWKINCSAVENLAKASTGKAKVIHISTDYVFDGQQTRPYIETDPTNPQSVYGKSKLAGEQRLIQYCPESMIIRTAWLYSEFGNNFVKTMLRLGKERDSLNVVADQIGTPTYAGDLAGTILDVIVRSENKQDFSSGIYHYSNEGICSWYDFTLEIYKLADITTCKVNPIPTSEYPTKAKRPPYSVLDKTKIKEKMGIDIPKWEESLKICIERIKK